MNKPTPSTDSLNDRIMDSVRSHQWKAKALTSTALAFGLLSIVASMVVAWGCLYKSQPVLSSLMADYADLAKKPGDVVHPGSPALTPDQQLQSAHVVVTYFLGWAALAIAASVTLLGIGTMVTLLLVIFNRRITLRQISLSLAQISEQMKALQGAKNSPGDRL